MNLAAIMQAVGALRDTRDGLGLLDPAVGDALQRLIPAAEVNLCDLDWRHRRSRVTGLAPACPEEAFDEDEHAPFWEHFWPTPSCSYTERILRLRNDITITDDFCSTRQWHSTGMYADYIAPAGMDKSLIMPLPGPPGTARRLVFFGEPSQPFTGRHRAAATILQPHIADALRVHARRAATQSLTVRQRELLHLVAAGHTNTAIARQLQLSPATVRKHLENTFARLGASSRTEAAAKIRPDSTWA
jgi:DNA-binding CsgD family transcriptional regulator